MKVNRYCLAKFIGVATLLLSSTVYSASIDQLQAAAAKTVSLQSQLVTAVNALDTSPQQISQLRTQVQQAKSKEVTLYQTLIRLKAEADYNKALASQDIVVDGQSDCERIDTDKECILKAEQAALAIAAKQGGHYFIEANSEQNNLRQQVKGKIETSVQFNEKVSMQVKAHVLGFSTISKNISHSPYTTKRQAKVKIKAQVAGQQNSQLKQSLLTQARAFYKPYLSSQELLDVSQYNIIQLVNSDIELVELPSGSFTLGSLKGDRNEYPQSNINVSGFFLSRLEVTKHTYNKCIQALVCSRELFEGELSEPAVAVSWYEITEEFIPWLSNLTGYKLRLPSEIEWEYAAKKGKVRGQLCTIANGNFKFAACNDDFEKLAPVGMLKPNQYGLYDMQGNAAEWTNSCWRYDHNNKSRAICSKAVIKGGSWYNKEYYLRPSARFGKSKNTKLDTLGFRLAM